MNETNSLLKRRQARSARRIAKREEKRVQRLKPLDNIKNVSNHDNLMAAFAKAKKGVGWKRSVEQYSQNAVLNIAKASADVRDGKPIHKHFNQFTISERGKVRHIRSVNIGERVIQKTLCDEVLLPALAPTLIYDNGACLKGKGTSFAENRLKHHLREYFKEHGSNEGYVLSTDFRKYFDNVDHAVLLEKISKYIHEPKVFNLIRHFITSFNEGNNSVKGKSIGLGSQISQIAAIYYPSCVDHFIKEQLRVHCYGRYMDDMYLFHHDKKFLEYCLEQIKGVCADLKLELNMKKTSITRLTDKKGVLFLKGHYFLLETGRIIVKPSKDSVRRQRRKITRWAIKIALGTLDIKTCIEAYMSWRGSFIKRFPNSDMLLYRLDNYFMVKTGYQLPL
jgi:hypothetical protein